MIRLFQGILASRLLQGLPFIQVILGPRQVGKTTGVKQVCESWGGESVFASADSPTPYTYSWLEEQWAKARALNSGRKLLVLDEIQKVEGWSEVVKKLYDEDRSTGLQVVLLGSASLSIQSKLSESLLGRYEIIRAHHWGLKESQQEFGWTLDQYLQFGGYPAAAALIEDTERWQRFMLDSVIEPVVARDISLVREIAKPALFRQTVSLVMHHPAMELSYQKILGQLQDRGNATTIKSYLETIEHAFLIKILEKYSTRAITTKSSSPKLFPLCPALISAFTGSDRILQDPEWRGRVVESAIGARLSQLFPDQLFYWRDGSKEVDFVIVTQQDLFAVEVKSGRKKGSAGIPAFKENFPGSRGLVLSEEFVNETLSLESKRDAVEFLLKISS